MAETYNINIEAKAEFDKIKELVAELNALNGQISKLNKATFSGVEKSAQALIDTGNSLTDAIKAQTAASDELKKSTDKAADGLKNAQDKTASFKQQTASAKDVLTGFYLELGAMAARFATTLPSAITKSIDAFGRQEMAVTKLAAAIRSQGGNVSDVLPIMQSFASEIQRITTYGDEQILEIQSFAASMGVLPNQMNQVIKSAIGLSTALGTDLKSATRAAVSLTFGHTQSLQDQIPSLRNCKSETEKLAKAQQLASSGFAQARDLAQTSAGKLKQAANAWGDLAETAGSVFAPVAVDVASLLKGMCEILSASEGLTAILTGSLTTLAVALTFQKIGGLPSLITQIKLVSNAVLGTDIAVKGLNATIKANPIMLGLSVAITAVSALTMAFSYFRGQAERTYKENIRDSEEYRSAIDSEIDAMKQWGITADANKKRTAEVAAEIAKLKTEQRNYGTSHGQTRYGQGGAYKVYSKEEQAQLDNYRAKIEKLQERQKAAADVKNLDALAAKKLVEAETSIAKIREKSAEEAAKAAGTNTALKKSAEMLKKATDELAAAEKAANDARNSGNAGQLLATEQRLAAAKTDRIAREKEYLNLLQASDEEQRLRQVVKLQSQKVDLDSKLVALKGQAPSDDFTEEYIQNDLLLRANQLQSEYISSRKALCRTEKEYNALVEEARQKSEQILNNERMRVGIVDKIASAQNEDRRLAAATKLQDLEIKIVQAKTNGDLKTAQSLELTQKAANLELRRCEIVKEQVDALKASCRTAEDYNNLVAQANKIADNKLAVEKFELDLSSTRYKNSKTLNQLELDILKAKANSANYDKQGRNRAVEAIEDKKSILQLQEQIFDSLRRENMTADELKKLHDYAINQAQQRVALERQATDEAQKQNIAKNAQAKIEDIILTHKIEQLKAEGKTGAAKALEEERDIKRTLGGLDGVSAEDKEKLANMMRQTNAYKDRQNNNRATPQAGGYAAPAGGAGGGYYGSAPASTGGRGPTPPKPPRAPATVSAKNMPLYEEWKAAGGTHTGQTFADFRQSRAATSTAGNDNPNKFRLSASRFIDNVGERAGAMAGVKTERKTPQKSESSNKKDDNVADGKLSSALSDLKKNKTPEGEKEAKLVAILTSMQKTLDETKTTITQLKSTVNTIATSK